MAPNPAPPQYNTSNVVTSGALSAAIISIVQLVVELSVPQTFWLVVQTKTQAWAAVQVILSFYLLKSHKKWFE